MAKYESVLVQSLALDNEEIDQSRLIEATYIECIDLSGPKLILKLNDMDSTLRDDFGLKEGSLIHAQIGSPNGSESILELDFSVVSYSNDENILSVNCLLKAIFDLKFQPDSAVFYVNKKVDAIINDLLPLKLTSDSIPQQQTYHLTPNITKAQLLRQICRENDLLMFVSRGELHVKKRENIMKPSPKFTYEYMAEGAEYSIRNYSILRLAEHYRKKMQRRHIGWSMTDGPIDSGKTGAPVLSSLPSKEQLVALSAYSLPIIEFSAIGNDALTVGMTLKLILHRHFVDKVIDESIPETLFATRVCHHQLGMAHTSVVELGVPIENE